jgi:hypothetical protein
MGQSDNQSFLLFNEKNILVSNSRTGDFTRLKWRHIAGCRPLLKSLYFFLFTKGLKVKVVP